MTNQFAIAPLDEMSVQLAKYRDTFLMQNLYSSTKIMI